MKILAETIAKNYAKIIELNKKIDKLKSMLRFSESQDEEKEIIEGYVAEIYDTDKVLKIYESFAKDLEKIANSM